MMMTHCCGGVAGAYHSRQAGQQCGSMARLGAPSSIMKPTLTGHRTGRATVLEQGQRRDSLIARAAGSKASSTKSPPRAAKKSPSSSGATKQRYVYVLTEHTGSTNGVDGWETWRNVGVFGNAKAAQLQGWLTICDCILRPTTLQWYADGPRCIDDSPVPCYSVEQWAYNGTETRPPGVWHLGSTLDSSLHVYLEEHSEELRTMAEEWQAELLAGKIPKALQQFTTTNN